MNYDLLRGGVQPTKRDAMTSSEHDEQRSMHGKTCLVTGASSGIGRETALGLARQGATVLLVVRDLDRGATVAAEIATCASQGSADVFVADLAAQDQVRELAHRVTERHHTLDVLVHNAAAVNPVRRVTADGVEATLAVNHLAPFLLTHLLAEPLRAAPAARVVSVSSYLHTMVKTIPWEDVQSEHSYRASATYNITKLMNLLFTYELARRWAGTRVTANALHPGWPLKTNLGREQRGAGAVFDRVTKLFGASAAKGARTSLFLASAPAVAEETGRYYTKSKPTTSSPLSHDAAAAQQLWQASEKWCGISPADNP